MAVMSREDNGNDQREKKKETRVLESAREAQEHNAEQMIAAVRTPRQHGWVDLAGLSPGRNWSKSQAMGRNHRQQSSSMGAG